VRAVREHRDDPSVDLDHRHHLAGSPALAVAAAAFRVAADRLGRRFGQFSARCSTARVA
jgi:hypothetical protein